MRETQYIPRIEYKYAARVNMLSIFVAEGRKARLIYCAIHIKNSEYQIFITSLMAFYLVSTIVLLMNRPYY
jgi:hypothetical protein